MKNLTTIILTAIVLFACKAELKTEAKTFSKEKQLKDYVVDQAMGMDTNYKLKSLEEHAIVSYQNEWDNFHALAEAEPREVDSTLIVFDNVIATSRKENDVFLFKTYNYYKDMFLPIQEGIDKNSTAYKVYKQTYQITNELLENQEVTVTNYPFFDSRDSLLVVVDDMDFDTFKDSFIQTPTIAYDMMYINEK